MDRGKALPLFFLSFLALPLFAQQPPADTPKLIERMDVQVMNVDVVVTDGKGNRVMGLTKDDFALVEEGKPQEITNFYEVRNSATGAGDATSDTPRELRLRRVIFFIDQYSIDPFRRKAMFASIDKFLDHFLQEGDEAMIVVWNRHLKITTPFTSDVAVLKSGFKALEKTSTGSFGVAADRDMTKARCIELLDAAQRLPRQAKFHYDQAVGLVEAYSDEVFAAEQGVIRALGMMISTLAGVEGKKVLIFAGSQLPPRPGQDLFMWLENSFETLVPNMRQRALSETANRSITISLDEVAASANANSVTVYTIDPTETMKGYIRSTETVDDMVSTTEFFDTTGTANSLGALAQATGGVGITRNITFDRALDVVSRDLDGYYSLGYHPAEQTKSGARRIAVRSLKSGLHVRARRSFVAKTPEDNMKDRVIANIFHGAVQSEWPVTLELADPVPNARDTWRVPITVSMPSTLTMLPQGEEVIGGFTIYFAVGDDNGAMSAVAHRAQQLRIPAAAERSLRAKPLTVKAEIVVQSGQHILSVGVVDDIGNISGFARSKVTTH